MATSPPNSYLSLINLRLSQVPQDVSDPVLYSALLDIHNAIEQLAFSGTLNSESGLVIIPAGTLVVNVLPEWGTVLIVADVADVTVNLYDPITSIGNSHNIVQIGGTYSTLIVSDSGKVDDDISGITIDALEAVPVINDGINWWIHN